MAATVKRQIALYATKDGKPVDIVRGKIAASQGILIPNTPMFLNTSGYWQKANTSDNTGDVIQGLFAGLDDTSAAWPITAELATSTVIKIALIDPDDFYILYVETNDSDSAITDAAKGNRYGLRVATGSGKVGYTTLDLGNTYPTVHVWECIANVETAKSAAADSPGRAIVKFIRANVEVTKAAE